MAVNPIKVWNGTAWEYTGPVVAAPPVKYQATAPTSPATGDVWVESDYDVASVDPSKLLTGGVYTNESTRSAAIPTPTTGMVTYVGDTGTESPSSTIPQLEAYTGAAWQNLGGMTLLSKVDFTTGTSFQVNNVFTSAYKNYEILLTLEDVSATGSVTFQLASGGTVNGSNNYTYAGRGFISSNAASDVWSTGLNSSFQIGYVVKNTIGLQSSRITLYNPQLTKYTTMTAQTVSSQADTQNYGFAIGGMMNVTTAYDGIRVNSSGNSVGTLQIYGLRNS
ncbi:hypothetical protein [Arenimonas sp.]|jgi:hypothetical protein|uniref:hypothetical protein n=1 Tax=Arenimonas sp. TaxID=1872635 RepID=UPI0037C04F93